MPESRLPRLTARESEVLRHVARADPDDTVARSLDISERTVQNHVRNIVEKLTSRLRMTGAGPSERELSRPRPAGSGGPTCPQCRTRLDGAVAQCPVDVESEDGDPTGPMHIVVVYCLACGHTLETVVDPPG